MTKQKKCKKNTPCDNENKCKIDGIIDSISDMPKQKIVGLNLSFRDIAKRGNALVCNYLFDNLTKPDQEIVIANTTQDPAVIFDIQTKIRRILSNWVNSPRNLTDSKGNYFGNKYGARILACSSDGVVLHDVQTFCRDVANNRVGVNNNYILSMVTSNNSPVAGTVNTPFFTTINLVANKEVITGAYSYKKTYKVRSSTLPTSNSSGEPLKYNVYQPELLPVVVVAESIIDLHTTRKEIIQSSLGKYGYNARRSDTVNTFNWYVARKWGNDLFTNLGSMYYFRLSYFEF
jgi:hypothetical protein